MSEEVDRTSASRVRKIVARVGAVVVSAAMFVSTFGVLASDAAPAYTVTGIQFTPGSVEGGAVSTWTVGFKVHTALAAGDTISVQFPSVAQGWSSIPSGLPVTLTGGMDFCSASSSTSNNVITLTLADAGGTCDVFAPAELTIGGVRNGQAGTYDTTMFAVSTSKDLAGSPEEAITIIPGTQVVTISGVNGSAPNYTYLIDPFTSSYTVSATSSGTGTLSYASSTPDFCSVNATTGAATLLQQGTCVITVTAASDATYLSATSTLTITVVKPSQIVNFIGVSGSAPNYTDVAVFPVSGYVATATASDGGVITYTSTTPGTCSVNATSGALTVLSAGSCVIKATAAATTNFAAGVSRLTISVAQGAAQVVTISGVSGSAPNYTDSVALPATGYTVSATASDGGVITYTTTTPTVCTVGASTGEVVMLSAGTCIIVATAAATVNYASGSSTLTIAVSAGPLPQIVTIAGVSGSAPDYYDFVVLPGTGYTVSATASDGGTITYSTASASVCSVNSTSGAVSFTTNGICVITATAAATTNSGAGVSTLTLTVSLGQTQTPLVLTSTSGTYGTTLTLSTSGGSGTGAVTYAVSDPGTALCTLVLDQLSAGQAGTCTVTATKDYDTTYLATSSAATTVTFAKAVQASLVLTSTSATVGVPLTLTSSGGSGTGAVSYYVTDPGSAKCVISAATLLATSAGTCTVTVTKAADVNYLEAITSGVVTVASVVPPIIVPPSAPAHAPAPYGIALSALGAPTSGTVSATAPTVVTVTLGTATVTLTVSAGALPVGTTVTIYPVSDPTALAASVPAGRKYVSAWAVAWQAPDGTAPNATTPVSLTIVDPAIKVGDTVHEITPTGVVVTATATVAGQVTFTFNHDPTFMVSTSAKLAQAAISVAARSGRVSYGLALAVVGGSGTGAVTYQVTNGTATGCRIENGKVFATTPGTCLVTATKAADDTYLAATSEPQTLRFARAITARVGPLTLRFANNSAALSPVAKRGLTTFAHRLRAQHQVRVTGYAFGDPRLARNRVNAVTAYLRTRTQLHLRITTRLVTRSHLTICKVTTSVS